ncbi:MAG TPA: GDSL-type esterase/lipase family protein [Stellaceae bacterium]|jgi:lysophospholipase L1-like esterase|nr:GDSL-type esterase/lipase family protein [Stellaceae bacterium]
MKEIAAGPNAILFLGDSLTRKWDQALWDRFFAPSGALNLGVNGDKTENLLWRLQNGNLNGQHPTAVVLLIGTNDIGRNRAATVIAQGIRDILTLLRERLPATRILLLGVLPRSASPGSRRRMQVAAVNHLLQTCEDREYVFYADLGDTLLDADGRLSPEISFDGVHLSAQGYALLTPQVATKLNNILNLPIRTGPSR